jgi:hypothetical protein
LRTYTVIRLQDTQTRKPNAPAISTPNGRSGQVHSKMPWLAKEFKESGVWTECVSNSPTHNAITAPPFAEWGLLLYGAVDVACCIPKGQNTRPSRPHGGRPGKRWSRSLPSASRAENHLHS